tara:strand:+ start:620 stop:814 length:195 start_codon:yes stop_codon:yes gene_type:complete
MERGLVHIGHSLIIGIMAYVFMLYGLKQSPSMAENRSVFVAALSCAYMVAFGHGPPSMMHLNHL